MEERRGEDWGRAGEEEAWWQSQMQEGWMVEVR